MEDIRKMEECDGLDSEVTELQELQCEASDANSQDDEDEVEELQNSLREAVQDQSVKPKLQCLMVDPSFSMVTVQSEDSGIVWETASSRCSTPWASETSSTSEAYSMEGSGGAGKITIVFDEDKVVRRRTRSGGRISRLGDRLSRPGSSRSASALGVERPEMAEVSLPNVPQEKSKTEADLEEIKTKDQQLFSLISEGYEILNIRVPSKLPTVDEEETTELQDNLSYLDQTPKIKSRNHHSWDEHKNQPEREETHSEFSKQDTSQPSPDKESEHTSTQRDNAADIDYFEKFTLLDVVVPGEQASELQKEEKPPMKTPIEEHEHVKEAATDSTAVSEDSFVFVTDVEIVGEHLDEVFYGEGPSISSKQRGEDKEEREAMIRTRRESQISVKESGSVLFTSEETTLTPIFISPGPPKIIDPILLEEPAAMSFMYSDLYEDVVGERRRSDEEYSEAESVASEKSCKRRFSDSDDADGYLEKFTLKDETPTVDVQLEPVDDENERRMVWPHSKFEMSGCLTRVTQEEEEKETTKSEELKTQEASVGDGSHSEMSDEKRELVTEAKEKKEEIQSPLVTQEPSVREMSGDSNQVQKSVEEQIEIQQVQHETEPKTESRLMKREDKTLMRKDHLREKEKSRGQSSTDSDQTQKMSQKTSEELPTTSEETAASSREEPESETQTETETAPDTKMVAADEKYVTEVETEASSPVKEAENVTLSLTEPSGDGSLLEEKEESPEDVFEVVTDCDCELQTVVEVTKRTVNEEEIQTQVQVDLQDVKTAVFEGEKLQESLTEKRTAEIQTEYITKAADQESEVLSEVSQPTMPKKVETESEEKKQQHMSENEKQESESQSNKENSTPETRTEVPAGDFGLCVQDVVSVDDEYILLVPKGQAVEMDIEIRQWTEKITKDTVPPPEPDHMWGVQEPELQTEGEPEVERTEQELPRRNFNEEDTPPALGKEVHTEEELLERDLEEDDVVFSSLRSFSPHEDLSELCGGDVQLEQINIEQKAEIHETEDVQETHNLRQDAIPHTDQQSEDDGLNKKQDEAVLDAPEETADELGYEAISKQDVEDTLQSETQKDAVESGLKPEEKTETETEEKQKEDVFDENDLIEADYEIFDDEEEHEARLTAELQGLDWFCSTCECLLSEDECTMGEHQGHKLSLVQKAYEETKEKLSVWISELQEKSENIEDLVSELELAYNSVEDQFKEREAAMRVQNEEMMAVVMEQYNQMSITMEEEKKAKLEQLYDKIVFFQENIDSTKATLETTAREAEIEANPPEDISARLKAALDYTSAVELGPKGLLVFEDYTKTNASSSNLAQRKGIPVPQRPTLQPQEPGSATSTNVTVYWKVNPGDIIDCFQVYCVEDPQGAVSEEYRVTVKESYCVLEELEPDKVYKVWVMATNYTGCSLPSEKLVFRTAPSVPVIDTERCTVMWDTATLRWSSTKQTPEQSYTLEYCRQYELEGEGLRSISGIKVCEQKVFLQPNENYLFYIKAVNEAGTSEQSEAALISTRGTRFHLLRASAHPALKLSEDQTTLQYSHDSHKNTEKECPSILGELLPLRGLHYWETVVSGSPAYRLGVTYSTANRNSSLGEDGVSWCLQCTPSPSGCRYQLLHDNIQASVFVTEVPERVGVLLDHQLGCLSFYNPHCGQLLVALRQRFTQPCHPALAQEQPGSLQVCMLPEIPEFTR